MRKILFVSHSSQRCGIYQFGKNTIESLASSSQYRYLYHESASNKFGAVEYLSCLNKHLPDAVIYNWNPVTIPWLNDELIKLIKVQQPFIKHLSIVHDEIAPFTNIDAHIHLDPDFQDTGNHFHVGRLIPDFTPKDSKPKNIIGSFGFGCSHKNYQRIVEQVNREFDEATVRLHIPMNDYDSAKGSSVMSYIEECRKIAKPGIKIEANHKFLSKQELLDWLADNTINCFFFDRCEGRGISSSIEYALAVKRPIAITDSCMFKHVVNATPSILIDKSSLQQIIQNGTTPLNQFYELWTKENLVKGYDQIIKKVIGTGQ